MGMPSSIGIVDTMLDLPYLEEDWAKRQWSQTFLTRIRDKGSRAQASHPAAYMFKPSTGNTRAVDPVDDTIQAMDRHNIQIALLNLSDDLSKSAVLNHPDRFVGQVLVDPNEGVSALRNIEEAVEKYAIKAVSFFPCGVNVAINDKAAYPVYAKCVELDIPIFINAGVPGPRVPYAPQYVGLVDEVCWFFPDLKIVLRHGAEPWVDLAVKLLLKWPNLYYSTSAFAPKHFPKQIVDFANTRGADKIIYAGYYPSGLTLERSFSELPHVPFRDHVWPKFLRDNALDVLKLHDVVNNASWRPQEQDT